jgi:general L-amino acid transport system permease protein
MKNQSIDQPKIAWWRHEKIRGILYQVILIGGLGLFFAFLANNLSSNLEKQGVETGFSFLWDQSAGFEINYTPFVDFKPSDTHAVVLLVGLVNTLLVGFAGVILTTIIGFAVGIGRLSNNWILQKVCGCYVEVFRNVPLLLQILFWYGAVILSVLPSIRSSWTLFDSFFVNNRGIYMPEPIAGHGFIYVVIATAVSLGVNFWIKKWAGKRQELTGQIFPVFITTTAIFFALPSIVFVVIGSPMTFEYPVLQRFDLVGGISIIPEFLALLLALSTYTAAFVAEIVRSGILSVSSGQTEAYRALGLKGSFGMRLVVLPQALRVIIPQLTNQYLNLIKNSSLATAIGYPEIAAVFMGTSMSNTNRTVEVMVITMTVYLIISLLTSMLMNWYNKKMALVER